MSLHTDWKGKTFCCRYVIALSLFKPPQRLHGVRHGASAQEVAG